MAQCSYKHLFTPSRLESLQIANYGIGGHYEPHFDHARETEDKFSDLGMGNRIATLLVYVSKHYYNFPV